MTLGGNTPLCAHCAPRPRSSHTGFVNVAGGRVTQRNNAGKLSRPSFLGYSREGIRMKEERKKQLGFDHQLA